MDFILKSMLGRLVFFLVSLFSSFCWLSSDPRDALKERWPTDAFPLIEKLIEATPTHHRHYFYPEDFTAHDPLQTLKQRLEKEISTPRLKNGFIKAQPLMLSYFLVAPCEILNFLSYIDHMVRSKKFEIISQGPSFFVLKLLSPFRKGIPLGVSFVTKIAPLSGCVAPFLKVIIDARGRIYSLYPVIPSASALLSPQELDGLIEKVITIQRLHKGAASLPNLIKRGNAREARNKPLFDAKVLTLQIGKRALSL